MTLAETLNEHACSCGLEEGHTFFTDSNGEEVTRVGDYRLIQNDNGVEVARDGYDWVVTATDSQDERHVALFTSDCTWDDCL